MVIFEHETDSIYWEKENEQLNSTQFAIEKPYLIEEKAPNSFDLIIFPEYSTEDHSSH